LENFQESISVQKQRALLVGAVQKNTYSDNLAELVALVESAGATVVDRIQQKITKPNPATYIGGGKAKHIGERAAANKADVVIFDNELSPAQIRELEEIIGTKVIDRSELILDIFASRARTKQAKLQVELAQLEYTYPRLTRMWSHLDTVTGAAASGGVGTRGTGEQQLEIDRRLISKKTVELKKELAAIDARKMREIDNRGGLFKICIVGYTNAGKSTLMNALTDADVYVEDRLFATLDTRTKQWIIEGSKKVLLSDTVGFVRNLPHQLVASFKATLEEAVNADLLLHVVDVSSPDAHDQAQNAKKVLDEIGCKDKNTLVLLNKADIVAKDSQLELLQTIYPDAICISAKTGMNLDLLKEKTLEIYEGGLATLRITISAANGKIQNYLESAAEIIARQFGDNTVILDVRIGKNQVADLQRFKPTKIEKIDIY
jgi:GTPase